jgi:hypothetical protein
VVVAWSEGTSNRSEKIEGKCIMDADGSGLLSKKIPTSTGFLRFIYFGMDCIEHQRPWYCRRAKAPITPDRIRNLADSDIFFRSTVVRSINQPPYNKAIVEANPSNARIGGQQTEQ